MRISDWSSDVCSSDLAPGLAALHGVHGQDVADAAAEERKFARDVRAGHPFHLPDRGDPQLAVVGRVVVGQDPDEAPVFASAHVQATGSQGWAPGREIGEVSGPALRPLDRKPPVMGHLEHKMALCDRPIYTAAGTAHWARG